MKRSFQVAAPLLASTAAALLTGCHPAPMQRCVDEQNRVVADTFCQAQGQNLGQQQPRPGGGFYIPYRYYYGGTGGYGIGSPVYGGSYIASPGVHYSSSTSRGGFGSTHGGSGEGHGGGGE